MKKLGRRRRARCSEVMRRRCAAYLRNLRRGRGGSAEAMFGSNTIDFEVDITNEDIEVVSF